MNANTRAASFTPPDPWPRSSRRRVFLAGSIDMGAAEDWQGQLTAMLADLPVDFLNPRREAWDTSWEQRRRHAEFRGQVEWELDGLDEADVIAMYLAPRSASPISLLELASQPLLD